MTGPLPPAPCPRCQGPGTQTAEGHRVCGACNLVLPDQPELSMIVADNVTVWAIGRLILEHLSKLESATSRADVLISLLVVSGWKLRHAQVAVNGELPVASQLPALMHGYVKADKVVAEQDREAKERQGVN